MPINSCDTRGGRPSNAAAGRRGAAEPLPGVVLLLREKQKAAFTREQNWPRRIGEERTPRLTPGVKPVTPSHERLPGPSFGLEPIREPPGVARDRLTGRPLKHPAVPRVTELNVEVGTASLRSGREATIVTILGELDLSTRDKLDRIHFGGPVILDLAKSSLPESRLDPADHQQACDGRAVRRYDRDWPPVCCHVDDLNDPPQTRVFETCEGAIASLDAGPGG
jgi:hypothetical protein